MLGFVYFLFFHWFYCGSNSSLWSRNKIQIELFYKQNLDHSHPIVKFFFNQTKGIYLLHRKIQNICIRIQILKTQANKSKD